MINSTVHDTFHAQARRTPTAVATWFDGQPTGYAELDAAADRIAVRLRRAGARPGTLVGVHLDRGVDQVAAVLGVLKAGAGFVMLDTAFPPARIDTQIAETRPVTVIVASRASSRHLDGVALLHLDDPAADPRAPSPGAGSAAAAGPHDLACVMFTSGSTGRPKAVAGSHRSLLISVAAPDFGRLGPGETIVQAAPVSWDAFILELFSALLYGGTVVLQPGQSPDPDRFARLVTRHRATTVFASASLLSYLIDEHPALFARVRRVWTGGDVASPAHAGRLLARHPGLRLVNGYGPVETMIAATIHPVSLADTRGPAIPVGHDTLGKHVTVLDRTLSPAPDGEIGELYISGTGLADGYLNQPATTATRFVARPGGDPGERMYRTGDLGRRRADGIIEYAGRADDQIKLNGFRLELGEIEAALARHPAVARAAATVHHTPSGAQLVGYVVPATADLDLTAVRGQVAASLPRHAVPTRLMMVSDLPRTHNGKLDRHALPSPGPDGEPGAGRPPSTDEERLLAPLFAESLGRAGVGVDDDFFALGGHSLLAARLTARIRDAARRDVDLRDVFAAPTVAALARRLAAAPPSAPGPESQPRPDLVPLSSGQQRMWHGYHSTVAPAGFHVARALHLRGPVDPAALAAALNDVVARHEALRTVYPVVDDRPIQRILDADRTRLDLPAIPIAEPDLAGALDGLTSRPFRLELEPPLRAALFTMTPGHAVLGLVLHHIACDGWSMGPLLADLGAAYAARAHGVAAELPELPLQYADYALWQHRLADGATAQTVRDWWAETLAGLPEESGPPPTRPLPASRTHRAGLVPVSIDAALHRAVADLARTCGATVFMVVHAAVAVLLDRLGAGTDVPVGTPVAGRADTALDDLVGFFVNTLVLRADVSGAPTVRELLRRVRDTDLAAYAHADTPFDRVVEAVNPDRRPHRNPLFQVMVAVRDAEPELRLPGVEVVARTVPTGVAQFDLTFDLVQHRDPAGGPAGITGDLEFDADLFDRASVAAMGDRLCRLLAALVADPDAPIDSLDVLVPGEQRLLTQTWQGPVRPAEDDCLPGLFARQVTARPDAVAVTGSTGTLSYAELDRRSDELAGRLTAAGVAADRIVAVGLPRSVELVIAVLAVAKAGGAFWVLDPTEPDPRTADMLAEAAPVCAVTDPAVDTGFLPDGLRRIPVTPDHPVAPAHPGTPDRPTPTARPVIRPEDAAYVVFTSGSTGAPKGVVVPHAAIVNCLHANRAWDPIDPTDRVLFKSAVTFDVAVREIFWPLSQGAAVVVAEPGGHRDPGYLADLIRRESITTVDFVPSMLPAFLDLATDPYPVLRRITCGGEPLPPAVARRCHTRLGLRPHNFYGPTEAAVEVTHWHWSPDQDDTAAVPLGRPGLNTKTLVLDDRLRPAPIGTVGDLYLAGPQLARGYLARPDRTAERFVAHPAGPPGARLYRTGDRARWRPDGALEFCGRDDQQVKISGLRVELGEIDTLLRAHPAVAECVVTTTTTPAGDPSLTAYAVAAPRGDRAGGQRLTVADLRAHLAARLPRPLIPTVMLLDALPLTRHGKLDRAALPAPSGGHADAPRRAPRTARERALCGLFAKVLGLAAVGVDDSFFDLGGHSLLATRLIARARSVLGVEITMAALFEFPTAAELAVHLSDTPPTRPALRPRPQPSSKEPR